MYLSIRLLAEGLVWAITSMKSAEVTVSNWMAGMSVLPEDMIQLKDYT